MNKKSTHKFYVAVAAILLSALLTQTHAQNPPISKPDTTKYPISDRRSDAYSEPSRNPFSLS
ncbi:MAG: hypothetical protein M3Y85_09365, partial [Bacteroidota bacterium]|nr:hypothetical protein [Bacteroidota bacterium]